MKIEEYFKAIKTPIRKRGYSGEYHIVISRNSFKNKFVGNFLNGTDKFYYKRNFTATTLSELLQKMYQKRQNY